MDKVTETIESLRQIAENDSDDSYLMVTKIDAIRLYAYIEKLEDENEILRHAINKDININIGSNGYEADRAR